MTTHIESPQEKQSGFQSYREDETQDGGGNDCSDSMRLR